MVRKKSVCLGKRYAFASVVDKEFLSTIVLGRFRIEFWIVLKCTDRKKDRVFDGNRMLVIV